MNKRGQAALEFLTTYGWAFLVILIMIGALAYFGVLNPSNTLPERCTFPPEMGCGDFRIDEVTSGSELQLQMELNNVNEKSVNINGIDPDTNFPDITGGTCALSGGSANPIAPNQDFQVDCSSVTGSFPGAGTKVKLGVVVNYTEVGGAFMHQLRGEVFGTING